MEVKTIKGELSDIIDIGPIRTEKKKKTTTEENIKGRLETQLQNP